MGKFSFISSLVFCDLLSLWMLLRSLQHPKTAGINQTANNLAKNYALLHILYPLLTITVKLLKWRPIHLKHSVNFTRKVVCMFTAAVHQLVSHDAIQKNAFFSLALSSTSFSSRLKHLDSCLNIFSFLLAKLSSYWIYFLFPHRSVGHMYTSRKCFHGHNHSLLCFNNPIH